MVIRILLGVIAVIAFSVWVAYEAALVAQDRFAQSGMGAGHAETK